MSRQSLIFACLQGERKINSVVMWRTSPPCDSQKGNKISLWNKSNTFGERPFVLGRPNWELCQPWEGSSAWPMSGCLVLPKAPEWRSPVRSGKGSGAGLCFYPLRCWNTPHLFLIPFEVCHSSCPTFSGSHPWQLWFLQCGPFTGNRFHRDWGKHLKSVFWILRMALLLRCF